VCSSDLKSLLPQTGFITVIPYGESIHGLNHTEILSDLGFNQLNSTNYRQITKEIWHKK